MKTPKIKNTGEKQAAAAAAAAQEAANNLQKNFQANLETDKAAQVVAGGTADALDLAESSRKKKAVGGLSSQLGINV